MRGRNLIDLTGRVFGQLTVIDRADPPPGAIEAFWQCRCTCGSLCTVRGHALRKGHTKSCGCLQKARMHGWETMKDFVTDEWQTFDEIMKKSGHRKTFVAMGLANAVKFSLVDISHIQKPYGRINVLPAAAARAREPL